MYFNAKYSESETIHKPPPPKTTNRLVQRIMMGKSAVQIGVMQLALQLEVVQHSGYILKDESSAWSSKIVSSPLWHML